MEHDVLVEPTTIPYRSSMFILEEGLSKTLTKKVETTSSPTTTTTIIELKNKRMYVEITYIGQTTNQLDTKQAHTLIEQTTSES
jgi:hypothetical protein